jgi:hypothetical protein
MTHTFIKDITLLELTARQYKLSGLDHDLLAKEVLAHKSDRLSDDPNSGLIEDSVLEIPDGSESQRLVAMVDEIAKAKGMYTISQWGQIHRPLESTNTHHHGTSPFAWVYYVKVPPGAGDLTFWFLDRFRFSVKPVEGNLILFPGWMNHSVSKNRSDYIRISIAGNLIQTTPTT